MNSQMSNSVYVNMMIDSLRRKKIILENLLEKTKYQATLLKEDKLDVDAFMESIEEKGKRIDELDQMDSGFEVIFKRMEKDLTSNKDAYKEEIQIMQKLIASISDLSVSVQALEKQNDIWVKKFLDQEKQGIKQYNMNQRGANTYFNNMNNASMRGQSYFINEMK